MISLATTTLWSDKRLTATSPVDTSEHRVDATDDRHRIGNQSAAHHVRQALDVDETRLAHVQPVGVRRAVADDVAADLATRSLDAHVRLALGHLEALGEDLEVVDQGFHRLVDARPTWRGDLLVLDAVVAFRHVIEDLAHDLHRLADLGEADRVPIEGVTVRADHHVEVELVVVQIGLIAAQVPFDVVDGSYGD